MIDLPVSERRRRLFRAVVLEAIEGGGYTIDWFERMDEDRSEATWDLLTFGSIERVEGYRLSEPHPFRLTGEGAAFLERVKTRISTPRGIDWKRTREIEWPRLP
jgi:hypothetical protein